MAEEHIKAFEKDSRAAVRGLVSRNPANAERFRERYGLDCRIEREAGKLLADKDIDIAVVCTPHNRHTEYVVAAAEAGKHVIIEKPVALTMADVKKQGRSTTGVKLMDVKKGDMVVDVARVED